MNKRFLFFNGRFLTQPVTGVQRFGRELLNALDKLLIENSDLFPDTHVVCLIPPHTHSSIMPDWKKIAIRQRGFTHGNIWEQFELPFLARSGLLVNLCNTGPLLHFKHVSVLHDASVFAVPNSYTSRFRLKYRLILFALSHTARHLITVSHFSAAELARYLGVAINKFTVINEGCDHLLRIESDEGILTRANINKKPFVLLVGSSSAHKNIASVIQAYQLIQHPSFNLVIIGGKYSRVFNKTLNFVSEGVIYLGYVDDNKLKALYQNAKCFIFPSFYEGFGLPPLEAMICGCPVLAADSASIPEICGDAAVYFNPNNLVEIKEQLINLISSPALQQKFIKRGLLRARKYTWHKSAEELSHIIKGIL